MKIKSRVRLMAIGLFLSTSCHPAVVGSVQAVGQASGNAIQSLGGNGGKSIGSLTPDSVIQGKDDPAIKFLFSSLSSPGIVGIGGAEGTLNSDGTPTSLYYGHTDPGNAAWNKGFGSWQASPVKDAAEGDQKAFERIFNQCVPHALSSFQEARIQLTVRLLVEQCDMFIQAPLAAADFANRLNWSGGDIVAARAEAYVNPSTGRLEASGFKNDKSWLLQDQARRSGEIEDALARGLGK